MVLGEKQEVFEKLLRSFEAYFDLAEDVTLHGVTYDATGEFHSRNLPYRFVHISKTEIQQPGKMTADNRFTATHKPDENNIEFFIYVSRPNCLPV